MKKLISFTTVIAALVINCMSVFGATVNIKSAIPQQDKSVSVQGSVLDAEDNQILTIMSTEYSKENGYDVNSLVYIDQLESKVDANGNFNISFFPSEDMKADSLYCVRIGGNNISTPALLLVLDNNAVPVGDADRDGFITANDAYLVLQSVLSNSTEGLTGKPNVTGNEVLTANDAAYILNKVIDPNFIFPVDVPNN